MNEENKAKLIVEVKQLALDNLQLSNLSDEELEEEIERLAERVIGNNYVPIEQRIDIVNQVYSSIRGLGLLDTIMSDDSITEVMINGADNIFIEKKRTSCKN